MASHTPPPLHVSVVLRFYGKNSSYVHGGLDGNGKPAEAVYGQSVSELTHSLTVKLEGGRKFLLHHLTRVPGLS